MSSLPSMSLRCVLVGVLVSCLGACATDEQWSTARESYPDDRWERVDRTDRPIGAVDDYAGDLILGNPDHFFLMQVSHINATEIELSRIAVERATDQQVRRYAEMMIDDHTRLEREVQRVADQRGIVLPQRPQQARQMPMAHLRNLSGQAFDEQYISMMIADHLRAVSIFESHLDLTTDSEMRDLADQGLPVLRHHLEEAQGLHARMSGTGMNDHMHHGR